MKKMLFFLILGCFNKALQAQYIYTIKADSVKITNTCDTAELIIENHTQNVPGFLFNKGKGRTEFKRGVKLNDSTLVLGNDTFMLRGNTTASNGLSMGGKDVQLGGRLIKDSTVIDLNSKNLIFNLGSGSRNFLINTADYGFGIQGPRGGNQTSYPQINFYMKDTVTRQGVVSFRNDANIDTRCLFFSAGDKYTYAMYPENAPGMFVEISVGQYHHHFTRFYRNGNVGIGTDSYRLTDRLAVRGNGLFTDTLKLPNILSKSDTFMYKPVVADAKGNLYKLESWPGSSTSSMAVISGASTSDVTAAIGTVTKLPDLTGTGSHSVILPAASAYAGQKIYIWNRNSSANWWTFSSSITLPDNTTTNSIPNQSTIELISDGTVWLKWN
ncbi:hypothetical protein [Longitalea arenae]|uniref:hypothetical protein n=1 Tax=Longitalea arenae TaxID=2812558 RepID=UPI001F07A433|nr:hypothetical protein [Longitalea arenae]